MKLLLSQHGTLLLCMLQEVVTEDTTVGSNHFKASEDNPKVVVKSEKSGKEVRPCPLQQFVLCLRGLESRSWGCQLADCCTMPGMGPMKLARNVLCAACILQVFGGCVTNGRKQQKTLEAYRAVDLAAVHG
jgi:hypothetical protein